MLSLNLRLFAINLVQWVLSFVQLLILGLWDLSAFWDNRKKRKNGQKQQTEKNNWERKVSKPLKNELISFKFFFQKFSNNNGTLRLQKNQIWTNNSWKHETFKKSPNIKNLNLNSFQRKSVNCRL